MRIHRIDHFDHPLIPHYDALFEESSTASIQQSSLWARVISDFGPDLPFFLLCEQDGHYIAGFPVFLFRTQAGNLLSSFPQAGNLGSIFVRDGIDPESRERAYSALLAEALQLASEQEALAFTTISSPFQADHELYRRYLDPDYEFETFTQILHIEESVAGGELRMRDSDTRNQLARRLRKLQAAGFHASWSASLEDLHAWYPIHEQRHGELGLQPIPLRFYERILQLLVPEGKAGFLYIRNAEAIISGGVYVWHRHIMDMFMMSMDTAHSALGPNWWNSAESIRHASALGIQLYNWQSSPNRDGGVYGYKKKWGSREIPYVMFSRLLCPTSRLSDLGEEGIRVNFPGHFLVPFGVFHSGFEQRVYRKGSS